MAVLIMPILVCLPRFQLGDVTCPQKDPYLCAEELHTRPHLA